MFDDLTISGGSGSIDPFASSLPDAPLPDAPFNPSLTEDVIESSSSSASFSLLASDPVLEDRFTISDYMLGTIPLQDTARAAIFDLIRNGFLARGMMSRGIQSPALAMLAISLEMQKQQKDYQDFVDSFNEKVDTFNDAIDTYNSNVSSTEPAPGSDAAAIDTINTAISQYNAGTIDLTAFTVYMTNYNLYATSRNNDITDDVNNFNTASSTYSSEVSDANATIDTLNISRAAQGLSLIPHITDPALSVTTFPLITSTTIPVASIPTRTEPIATIDHIPDAPSQSAAVTQMQQTLLMILSPILALFTASLDLLSSMLDRLAFDNPTGDPTVPSAFIERKPEVFLGTTPGGVGGVSLAAVATGLTSANVSGEIQDALENATDQQFIVDLITPNLEAFATLGLQILGNSSVISNMPGLRAIGTTNLASAAPATAFSLAFGVTNEALINQVVESDYVNTEVRNLVDQLYGNTLDDVTKQQISDTIASQINISLLQNSLLVQSQVTGLSGLVGQVQGTVLSVPEEPRTYDQVASDISSTVFVKERLSSQLASEQSISSDRANEITQNAIDDALSKGTIASEDDLKQRISDAYVQQGIDKDTADSLASQAADIFNAETTAQVIGNQDLYDQTKVQDSLQSALLAQGNGIDSASTLAANAAQDFFNTATATNSAEYQIQLADSLVRQGIATDQANAAAANLVATLNVAPAGASPLQSSLSTTQLDLNAINEAYYTELTTQLTPGLGSENARAFAEEGVSALNTTQQLLSDEVNQLATSGQSGWDQRVAESFSNFQSPNTSLYQFSQNLTDPANSFILSANTGISYSGVPQPSSFKKSVDIIV